MLIYSARERSFTTSGKRNGMDHVILFDSGVCKSWSMLACFDIRLSLHLGDATSVCDPYVLSINSVALDDMRTSRSSSFL